MRGGSLHAVPVPRPPTHPLLSCSLTDYVLLCAYVTPSTFGEDANHGYPFRNGYQSIVFCIYQVKQNYGMDVHFTKSPFVGTGNESGSVIITASEASRF